MSSQELFDENAELIQFFTIEGEELLDNVEPKLIELQESLEESGEIDIEILNGIFRMFYTLKSSAGFLKLNNLLSVTHKAETLLDLFRKGIIKPRRDNIDLLIRACDFICTVMVYINENRWLLRCCSRAWQETLRHVFSSREEKA